MPTVLGRIRAWLDGHFHRYRLVEAIHGNVPLDLLLATGRFDPAAVGTARRRATHAVEPWLCHLDVHDRRAAVAGSAGEGRGLGCPQTSTGPRASFTAWRSPTVRGVLHVVGKRVDIAFTDPWGTRPPGTRIVVIGAEGAVDGDALRAVFDGCRAS